MGYRFLVKKKNLCKLLLRNKFALKKFTVLPYIYSDCDVGSHTHLPLHDDEETAVTHENVLIDVLEVDNMYV